MQTNGRTSSPVYVGVVNREQKGVVTWSFTSRGSAAIDWPKHSYPERVMLDGFHDLAKPRNSKIQRKPENTILWQGDNSLRSALGIFLFGSHRQCLVDQLSSLQEQRGTISVCPFPQQRRLGFQRTKNCPVSIGRLDTDPSREPEPRIYTIAASQLAT